MDKTLCISVLRCLSSSVFTHYWGLRENGFPPEIKKGTTIFVVCFSVIVNVHFSNT